MSEHTLKKRAQVERERVMFSVFSVEFKEYLLGNKLKPLLQKAVFTSRKDNLSLLLTIMG